MPLTSFSVLNSLIEMAEKELNAAEEALAKANKALKAAKKKGELLAGYKQDYVNNFEKQLEMGVGKETHQNYQSFLNNLAMAVAGQDDVITAAEYEVEKARRAWQVIQHEKLSYEVLLKRKKDKIKTADLKKEQKMMDEFAMRAQRKQMQSDNKSMNKRT